MLKAVPGKSLAFEWITFAGDASLGRNAPPLAPHSLRDAVPLPTWVELEFVPIAGDRPSTRVQLAHYGFKDDALWEEIASLVRASLGMGARAAAKILRDRVTGLR